MGESGGKFRALVLTALLVVSALGATVMFTGVSAADTLVVDKNDATNYGSIQNAVDNASDGDTVEVRPGMYNYSDDGTPADDLAMNYSAAGITYRMLSVSETATAPDSTFSTRTVTFTTDASTQVDVDPGDLSGSGTASDPYVITNASELQAMEDDLSAQYELGNDIDASGIAQWNNGAGFAPIGPSFNNKFTGVIDGAGHTIDGLTINRPTEDRVGLIGVLDDEGTVRNVSVVDANITGNYYTGGLVGTSDGTVVSSSATGTVTGTSNNAGGLAGSNDGLLTESSAQVTVTGGYQVGGLVGLNAGTVRESYATGSVSASGDRVGGLVATNVDNATVSSSYATGTVTGNSKIGGLVGLNPGTIQQTVAVGSVSGSSDVGGLVGNNTASFAETPGTVKDSYFDEQATGQPTSAGNATDLTTAQMTGQAAQTNMTGFDFEDVWQVQSSDYPVLSWQVNSSGGGDVSADLVVDADGTQDYETIQAALDNASDGDIIEVRPGIYEEAVDITNNVTLTAPDGATVANTSTVASEYSPVNARAGLQVFGPATPTIEGFTLTGWQWGFSAGASKGAWTLQDTVIRDSRLGVGGAGTPAPWTVDNVTVVNATYGLSAYQSSGDWVVRNSTFRRTGGISGDESSGNWVVEQTTIRNGTDEGVDAEGANGAWTLDTVTIRDTEADAIDVDNSSGQWVVRDSIFDNATEEGVTAEGTSGDWTIQNTTVESTGDSGIDAGRSSGDLVIRNSTVRDTGFHGIEVEFSTGAWTIESTTIQDIPREGIDAFEIENRGTIDDVKVTDTEVGVNFYNSSGPWTIEESVIQNNSDVAITAGNAEGEWEIHQSVLTNGTGVAIAADNAQIEGNATYNYWGASDGPSGDFSGSGAEAFGNVTVEPFYSDEALTSLGDRLVVGGESGEYNSIQDAVNNADEGDTIIVNDGTYRGVRINEPGVTVRAADGANPVIEGPETLREQPAPVAFGPSSQTGPFQRTTRPVTQMGGRVPIISDRPAVVVTENDTTIEGFEIGNPAGTTGIEINESVDGATIKNNVIKNLEARNIVIEEATGEAGLESFWGLDTGPSERDSLSGLDGGSAARDSFQQLGALGPGTNGPVTGILLRGDHSDISITDNRIENLALSDSDSSFDGVRGIAVAGGTLSNSVIANNVVTDLESNTTQSVGISIQAGTESVSLSANEISNVRSVSEGEGGSYAAGIEFGSESESITGTEIIGNDISGVTSGNNAGFDLLILQPVDGDNKIRDNQLRSNIGLYYESNSEGPQDTLSVGCNYWGGSLGPVEISEFNEDGTVQTTDDNVQPATESVNLDNRVRSAVTDNVEFRPFLTEDPASVAEPNCGDRAPVPLELTVGNTPITSGDFPNFELTETMSGDQVNGTINVVGGPTEPTGSDGLVAFQIEDEGTVTVIATKESTSRKNFQADEITLDVASGGSGTTGGDGGDGSLDQEEDGTPAPSTPEAPSTPGGTPAEGTSDDEDTAGQDSDPGSTPASQQDQESTPGQAATPDPDVTTPDPEQEPGGFGGPTALIGILVLIIAGGVGLYYLRQRQ